MKKSLLLFITSITLWANVYDLKPMKITDDISCLIGDLTSPTKENKGFISNVCYVDIGDSIVLLDAGPTYLFAKELNDLIKKDYPNKKISHVVLTNFHDDRIQGASFFKDSGGKILGHKTLNEDIKTNSSKFDRMKNSLPKELVEGTKVVEADLLVDDGYEIKGSLKTLRIIKPSVVSEEKSDIAIFSETDSFLFVGNMVFNERLLNYTKNSNIDGWIEALEKLASLNVKYLLGGHGKQFNKDSYKTSLEYLEILRDDVKKAYEDGIESDVVSKHVNTQKFNYLENFSALNHSNIQNFFAQLEWQ